MSAADASLIEAAKKEGRVVWYTTQIVDQFVRPAQEAFKRKYGIEIDYVRSGTPDMVLRVTNEAKAGAGRGDIVVNGKPVDVFFSRETGRMIVRQPLELTNHAQTFDIKVNVFGGGVGLYAAGKKLVGGLGVSGDTSCADHSIAWRIRNGLALDHLAGVGGAVGAGDGGRVKADFLGAVVRRCADAEHDFGARDECAIIYQHSLYIVFYEMHSHFSIFSFFWFSSYIPKI